MLIVMESNVDEGDVQRVIDRMVTLGFDVHRSSGMTYTVLGGIGDALRFEIEEFRGMPGVREAIRISSRWKLAARRAHPQGSRVRIGAIEIGGEPVAELPGGATLRVIWESSQVRVLSAHADALVVPAQAMENEALLRELGRAGVPVILKRGECSTVDDWIASADLILQAGNAQVVLCECGVRAFSGLVLDVAGIAEARRLTHLPVIAAPGDTTIHHELLDAIRRAALAAGAQGLLD